MVICANCRHYPGPGQLCAVAKRHATHHRRSCRYHRTDTSARHVATLRRLAVDWLHQGDHNRYAVTLDLAHQAREAMR
ncbi:hypothetical protein ACN2MM_05975 [Alkalilimnicola ehrlichii MLHE-1]|uniref:Uncharacterized protein n=1 Tax=Alkalilimnicola ehrlichii (strain ATCC BAA-1101 / DSM 17681 / MLHE-1) TaxID=187272 RepID=Q0A9S0_ALKEH|nr:hypothetical protein [Alkalilimnicola ehrlichii]ABI56417.1 hypothetical protein Mlg_1065 [Alkalilimnicola ehrlichii MLHE-1]